MIRLGLTGRIGSGKSAVLSEFVRLEGVAGYDCDVAVHDLYRSGGVGAAQVGRLFPEVIDVDGGVDRARLREIVFSDADARGRLEAVVHPLVERVRRDFFYRARRALVSVAVIEYSLLFETFSADEFDVIAVVTAPDDIRRDRVLARPGMSMSMYAAIVRAQRNDMDVGADFVIHTGCDFAGMQAQVRLIDEVLRL